MISISVSTLSISACEVPEVKIILHTCHTCKNMLVSALLRLNGTIILVLWSWRVSASFSNAATKSIMDYSTLD